MISSSALEKCLRNKDESLLLRPHFRLMCEGWQSGRVGSGQKKMGAWTTLRPRLLLYCIRKIVQGQLTSYAAGNYGSFPSVSQQILLTWQAMQIPLQRFWFETGVSEMSVHVFH